MNWDIPLWEAIAMGLAGYMVGRAGAPRLHKQLGTPGPRPPRPSLAPATESEEARCVFVPGWRVTLQTIDDDGPGFVVASPMGTRVGFTPNDPLALRAFPVGTPCDLMVRPSALRLPPRLAPAPAADPGSPGRTEVRP